jgi:hypothetical protein
MSCARAGFSLKSDPLGVDISALIDPRQSSKFPARPKLQYWSLLDAKGGSILKQTSSAAATRNTRLKRFLNDDRLNTKIVNRVE